MTQWSTPHFDVWVVKCRNSAFSNNNSIKLLQNVAVERHWCLFFNSPASSCDTHVSCMYDAYPCCFFNFESRSFLLRDLIVFYDYCCFSLYVHTGPETSNFFPLYLLHMCLDWHKLTWHLNWLFYPCVSLCFVFWKFQYILFLISSWENNGIIESSEKYLHDISENKHCLSSSL